MNANVVKRDMLKVILDSISISQYLYIVALVITVWTQTLCSVIDWITLLSLDALLLFLGFSLVLLTTNQLSLQLLSLSAQSIVLHQWLVHLSPSLSYSHQVHKFRFYMGSIRVTSDSPPLLAWLFWLHYKMRRQYTIFSIIFFSI